MDKIKWIEMCREWCKEVKFISDEIVWDERPNHSGWLQATSALLDRNRVSIPSLFFSGEYSPGRFGDRISYGLMHRRQKEVRRVFMIEVYPHDVRSHQGPDGAIFGPHLHLGDYRLMELTRPILTKLNNAHAREWVARFRRHAKILDNGRRTLTGPAGDLFG